MFFLVPRCLFCFVLRSYCCCGSQSLDARKHCVMHTNNLGIFLILNAEGLQVLARHRSSIWGCTFNEALSHLYDDFRSWCRSKSIKCSHRKWHERQLHLETAQGEKTLGWLNAKAFNARVILAWLSVPSQQVCPK